MFCSVIEIGCFAVQVSVVQKVDGTIRRINLFPLNNAFAYPLHSDLIALSNSRKTEANETKHNLFCGFANRVDNDQHRLLNLILVPKWYSLICCF